VTSEAKNRSGLMTADALEAFFDMVSAPAALCDATLVVQASNAPFAVLCGEKELLGRNLVDVLGVSLVVPDEGRVIELEVTCRTRQHVQLTVSRRGQTVAVVAKQLTPALDSLAAAGRALLEQARIETQLLEIGRAVVGSSSEEELVASVARGVKALFPGRAFAVRTIDPRTCALTSLYAEGRMREGVRDVFHLRRSMLEKTHLDAQALPPDRVVIVPSELPLLFDGSVRGVSAPLVASGQLFGAINIEYPPGLTADLVADQRVLIQLANQVAVAVRNVKLIDELTFVRKYLEDLLENGNALILVVNRDQRVVVFNRALSQLTGLEKGAVLGADVGTLVPEAERLKVSQAFTPGGPAAHIETVLQGVGKRQVKVTFNTSSVLTHSGEVEGIIAIGQDLTRLRELERRVIQAEKLASLGQLAASVVHEINNPMTAVATYAEALLQRAVTSGSADQADVEKYRRIVSNSERVLRFTKGLVSYARPATDKPELVELKTLVERAAGFCEHVLVKHGITVEYAFGVLPAMLMVRQNVIQVFVNLITNACHATPRGGKVTVGAQVENERAVVTVRDSGSGIDDETKQHIFEPFFSTKPDGEGTGLGLSIVQSIMESHGGSVTVNSIVGSGTTFTLSFPLPSS
jgi:two-component system, NtrC family, sensor kinase